MCGPEPNTHPWQNKWQSPEHLTLFIRIKKLVYLCEKKQQIQFKNKIHFTSDMCVLWVLLHIAAGAPVKPFSAGLSFPLNTQIPNHVFRVYTHDRVHPKLQEIIMNSTNRFNMTTVFVDFGRAYQPLVQCGALDAFNQLIPGAFKADLLRYCLVWLHGGWYADMSTDIVRDPQPLGIKHNLVVVADPTVDGGLLNGFFGASPRHPGIRAAIDGVINNVAMCFYGERDLAPTGPILFGNVLRGMQKHVLMAHMLPVPPKDCSFLCFNFLTLSPRLSEVMQIGDPALAYNKFVGYRKIYKEMGYDKDTASYSHLWKTGRVYRNCKGANNHK